MTRTISAAAAAVAVLSSIARSSGGSLIHCTTYGRPLASPWPVVEECLATRQRLLYTTVLCSRWEHDKARGSSSHSFSPSPASQCTPSRVRSTHLPIVASATKRNQCLRYHQINLAAYITQHHRRRRSLDVM